MTYIRQGDEAWVGSVLTGVEPSTTALPDGTYLIVWSDMYDIRAQRFDASGDPLGASQRVNVSGADWRSDTSVTSLSGGGYVVAWTDSDAHGASGGVRARLFTVDGSPVAGEFTASDATTTGSDTPVVSALSGGGFVVTWCALVPGNNQAVMARIYDASGVATGPAFAASAPVRNRPDHHVDGLEGGGFVLSWTDGAAYVPDGPERGIRLQLFDSAGARVGPELLANSQTAGLQSESHVTALPGGGFVVTWRDASGVGGDASVSAIKGQVYDSSGVRVGGEFLVNSYVTGEQSQPTVAGLHGGGFVICWTDASTLGGDDAGTAIKGQVFDAAGVASGPEFLINTQTAGSQLNPAIAALNDGGFAVSWSNVTPGGVIFIQSQAFAPSGLPPSADRVSITSGEGEGATYIVVENGVAVATISAQGTGAPTYAIAGGVDAARFAIDPATGELTFRNAPDFEAPGDAGRNNVYDLIVRATVGSANDEQRLRITVTDQPGEDAVAITSHGASARIELAENGAAVARVVAEGSAAPAYSIAGGADAALFNLDPATGELAFRQAPDFETPVDAGGDNNYDVVVRATVGNAHDDVALTVAVGDVAEDAVRIVSHPQPNANAVAIDENGRAVAAIVAEGTGAPVYSVVGGADAALFTVDAVTGQLAFRNAPDFESPADVGRDNVYDVVVRASVGGAHDDAMLAVTVGNVAEDAVRIVSHPDPYGHEISVDENGRAVTSIVAEGTGAPVYKIVGGDDAALFRIDAATGALSFITAPDYERAGDANRDNLYRVTVRATVGEAHDDAVIGVRVLDLPEGLAGTDGADLLIGTDRADILDGRGGDDRIDGGLGDDDIRGGSGRDELVGGDGNDRIVSDEWDKLVDAGLGDDFVEAVNPSGRIDGGEGFDRLLLRADTRFMPPGPFNIGGFEVLEGEVVGGFGADSVDLSPIGAIAGEIIVDLFDGNDRFTGGGERDIVFGGYGDDVLEGGAGDDRLDGGAGFDTAAYSTATGGVRVDLGTSAHQDTVSAGYDALLGIEHVLGSAFADTLRGNAGANRLDGGAGDDILYGLDGGDLLIGGAGRDGLDGGYGNDQLQGGSGDDQLFGNAGDDRLSGGDGADLLIGGTGRDLFVFEAIGLRDTIRDFSSVDDSIALSRSVFSSLSYTSSGTINAAHFVNGTRATTASQHLIYDRSTGNLFYDADGSGAGAQVLIANFESRPLVAASDFVIGG